MITHVLFPVAFRVHCTQQIVLVAVRAQNVPINEFKKHKTQCLADTAPFPSPAAPPQLTTFISLLFNFFNFPSTTTCLLFPPLLFHFISPAFPPPSFHFLLFPLLPSSFPLFPPFLIYSFPSTTTTTTFLLFSLHHHISIVFLPPPHFYCFPSTTTTTFLLFSFHHHHHHISIAFPPPPPPPHFYCFPSTTTTITTFLLFSLHHHHISNVFPPPPHFIIFFATYTRQVIWKVRRPKPGQTIQKKNKKGLPGNILPKVVVMFLTSTIELSDKSPPPPQQLTGGEEPGN